MIRFVLVIVVIIIDLILMIPFGIAVLISNLFGKNVRDSLVKLFMDFCFFGFKVLSGTKVTYKGLEKLPKDGPVLYVANHQSFFDVILVSPKLPKLTSYVCKKSFEKIPVFSQIMKLSYTLFLDRDDIKQGLKIILQAIEYIKSGISVFIFPEGTRSKTGEMNDFKEGSMKVSTKTGCPIVPIAISNTSAIWEDHFPKITKEKVIIEVLDPIYPADFDKDAVKHIGKYCHDLIDEARKNNNSEICENKVK